MITFTHFKVYTLSEQCDLLINYLGINRRNNCLTQLLKFIKEHPYLINENNKSDFEKIIFNLFTGTGRIPSDNCIIIINLIDPKYLASVSPYITEYLANFLYVYRDRINFTINYNLDSNGFIDILNIKNITYKSSILNHTITNKIENTETIINTPPISSIINNESIKYNHVEHVTQ